MKPSKTIAQITNFMGGSFWKNLSVGYRRYQLYQKLTEEIYKIKDRINNSQPLSTIIIRYLHSYKIIPKHCRNPRLKPLEEVFKVVTTKCTRSESEPRTSPWKPGTSPRPPTLDKVNIGRMMGIEICICMCVPPNIFIHIYKYINLYIYIYIDANIYIYI